ncbi:hypothetical protein ACI2KD_05965 [Pseudomonas monteilii]
MPSTVDKACTVRTFDRQSRIVEVPVPKAVLALNDPGVRTEAFGEPLRVSQQVTGTGCPSLMEGGRSLATPRHEVHQPWVGGQLLEGGSPFGRSTAGDAYETIAGNTLPADQ